jgi:hypothetical protein
MSLNSKPFKLPHTLVARSSRINLETARCLQRTGSGTLSKGVSHACKAKAYTVPTNAAMRAAKQAGCIAEIENSRALIDKWNGQLPTVESGQGSGMILQLLWPQ